MDVPSLVTGKPILKADLLALKTAGELLPLVYKITNATASNNKVIFVTPLSANALRPDAFNLTNEAPGIYKLDTDTFTPYTFGGEYGVASVSGNIVDGTDPANPKVNQVQADWGESDSDKLSFIKNRVVELIAVIVGPTPPTSTGDVEYDIPIKGNYEILDYSISAQDAPIGGTTTIGLKKNGSSITTTGVSISSGSNDSTGTPTFSNNDISNSKLRFTFTAIASYAGSRYIAYMRIIKK
jgi:hypothetical protein